MNGLLVRFVVRNWRAPFYFLPHKKYTKEQRLEWTSALLFPRLPLQLTSLGYPGTWAVRLTRPLPQEAGMEACGVLAQTSPPFETSAGFGGLG